MAYHHGLLQHAFRAAETGPYQRLVINQVRYHVIASGTSIYSFLIKTLTSLHILFTLSGSPSESFCQCGSSIINTAPNYFNVDLPLVPYATPSGFSDDITKWLVVANNSQAGISKVGMFKNINTPGSANGTVVASQSVADPDYAYNWVCSLCFRSMHSAANSFPSCLCHESMQCFTGH